jgi:hypothetical protein
MQDGLGRGLWVFRHGGHLASGGRGRIILTGIFQRIQIFPNVIYRC